MSPTLVKYENPLSYPQSFKEGIVFHREAAIFLQNCSIKLIPHSYVAIPEA